MKFVHNVFAAILALLPLFAHADVITFTGETPGAKPAPYVVGGVEFGDSASPFVLVGNFPENFGNTALAAPTDDDSYLIMLFPSLSNSLSLDFGNDDPRLTQQGDLALLILFLGNVEVDRVAAELNRDDLVNQTISSSGVVFDSALFAFTNGNQEPIFLSEVIDNIAFTPVGNAVPEPATIALCGFSLLGLALSRRRARA